MKIKERTLENLRNNLKGKIHVYLKDGETMRRFFADADEQGWLFGTNKPSTCTPDSIIALEYDKQLSYLGIAGRICFQTNGGSNPKGTYHRIDYAKYTRVDKNYYFDPDKPSAIIRNA